MLKKTKSKNKPLSDTDPCMTFITTGLGCHALCLLKKLGILERLITSGFFSEDAVQKFRNPALLKAALATLVAAQVLKVENKSYSLTQLGQDIVQNIGALLLPFDGYKDLLSKQLHLMDDPEDWSDDEIDYKSIAISSINFGVKDLDPILINLIDSLRIKGTLCDFGCGTAEKLSKICKQTHLSGLGIEKDRKVIQESHKFTSKHPEIEIVHSDIQELTGVWEDVEVGLISFVLHDIHFEQDGLSFLNSLKKNFPRIKCLIVVDIVSFSESINLIMPGFDYVHGLQGVTPRTYEETHELFEKSKLQLIQEIKVPNMPNTFIWVLKC